MATGLLRIGTAALMLAYSPAPWAGEASDFTLPSIDGQDVHLSQFRGQVVVLSFWATWCGPCKAEMPHLQKLQSELAAQGFTVLAISSDDARTSAQVQPYIKKTGYTFPVLLDTASTVTGAFNPTRTLPYTVIIDRLGNIVNQHSGYHPGDEVGLRAEVEALLNP